MQTKSWKSISLQIQRVDVAVTKVNELCAQVVGSTNAFFRDSSLRAPSSATGELVFYKCIFWLSSLLHECGGRPLRFCMRQSQYLTDARIDGATYMKELGSLRTIIAHNLDPTSDRDRTTDFICRQWFAANCGIRWPKLESHWERCCHRILKTTNIVLGDILRFLVVISRAEDSDLMIKELRAAIQNQFSPYEFEEIARSVLHDIGREDLCPNKLRVNHYSDWQKELDKLVEGFHFPTFARALVERTALRENFTIPIDGQIIMQRLRIPPGPLVGKFIKKAYSLFEKGIRDPDDLLEKLASFASENSA